VGFARLPKLYGKTGFLQFAAKHNISKLTPCLLAARLFIKK
jgi:hypothetical protein